MASENKRIAKNTGFLYIRLVLVMLASLYMSRVVLKTLGIVDYGLYNVIGGVVTMLAFLNNCASASTSRFLTFSLGKNKDYKYNDIFCTAFSIHFLLAILIVIVAETVGLWYIYNKMVFPPDRLNAVLWVYHISVLNILVSFTQVPYNASLISHEKMDIYAYTGLYEAFAKLLVAYLLFLSPVDKLITYAILLFGVTVSLSFFYRWYCRKEFNEKCRLHLFFNKDIFRKMISYSGWDLIGNFSSVARSEGVNLILNLFCGPAVNAARAVAYQAEAALYQFTSNFLQASRPVIIKLYASKEIDRMLNLLYNTGKFAFLLFSCLAIPIALESDTILKLWLVTPPFYASIFLSIILLNYMVISLTNTVNIGVYATGDVKRLNIYAGSKIFLELPIIYVLMKAGFQPYWSLIVLFIGSSFVIWIDLWVLRKNIPEAKISLFFRKVVLVDCLIIAIPTFFSYWVHFYMQAGICRLILVCMVYWFSLLPFVYKWGLSKEIRHKLLIKLKNKF